MAFAPIRRILPFLSVAILIGILYDGFVFYSRWSEDRKAERVRAAKESEEAHRTLDLIGHLKIVSFYAYPAAIERGQTTSVCYGVIGAKSVRLEPSLGPAQPALSRCLQASPRADTEYRLIAADDSGHTVSQNITVKVMR